MKITISKSQWEEMGRKAGWDKIAEFEQQPQVIGSAVQAVT